MRPDLAEGPSWLGCVILLEDSKREKIWVCVRLENYIEVLSLMEGLKNPW